MPGLFRGLEPKFEVAHDIQPMSLLWSSDHSCVVAATNCGCARPTSRFCHSLFCRPHRMDSLPCGCSTDLSRSAPRARSILHHSPAQVCAETATISFLVQRTSVNVRTESKLLVNAANRKLGLRYRPSAEARTNQFVMAPTMEDNGPQARVRVLEAICPVTRHGTW